MEDVVATAAVAAVVVGAAEAMVAVAMAAAPWQRFNTFKLLVKSWGP